MAKALFTNNATATLATAIVSAVATSCVLTAGQGALFPAPSAGNYFWATIVDASNNKEIVKVTANAADTFTMVRAQEGTTGLTFATGSKVELRPTAAGLNGMLAAGNDLSDLNSASTARTNLGLGTAALLASSAVLQSANNLSDLANAATARTNLGVVAFGGDSTYNFRSNNLSDVASASTARGNLALGTGNDVQFTSIGLGTAGGGGGTVRATGDITAFYSDDRLKTRLGKFENAIEKIMSLEVFHYQANARAVELGYEVDRQIGMSAQQWQRIAPELVAPAPISYNIPEGEERDYLTLKYERTTAVLVAAFQELYLEFQELKRRA